MFRDIFQENPRPDKKIDLSNYDYISDVESRMKLAELGPFEIEVLQEIIDGSLTFTIPYLADILGAASEELMPILQKFSDLRILDSYNEKVHVNKERRKYLELELVKFEENFIPDISYAISLLKNKVPLHVLPNWYPIPKMADDMFLSLIEKYLETPQTYQKYLAALSFDDPAMDFVVSEIKDHPDQSISVDDLILKFQLSRRKFEEMMLFFEFSFVGYLCYECVDNRWKGVIRPFAEWGRFYSYKKKNSPRPIEEKVARSRPREFPFLSDMTSLLIQAQKSPLKMGDIDKKSNPGDVIEKCLALKLVEMKGEGLLATEIASSWISAVPQDQAVMLYRHPENVMKRASQYPRLYTPSSILLAEKALKDVVDLGWLSFHDFVRGLTLPIGDSGGVSLVRNGCKWCYRYPKYSEDEIQLIYDTIFERLFQCGIIAVGTWQNQPCFQVTPFGKSILG